MNDRGDLDTDEEGRDNLPSSTAFSERTRKAVGTVVVVAGMVCVVVGLGLVLGVIRLSTLDEVAAAVIVGVVLGLASVFISLYTDG